MVASPSRICKAVPCKAAMAVGSTVTVKLTAASGKVFHLGECQEIHGLFFVNSVCNRLQSPHNINRAGNLNA